MKYLLDTCTYIWIITNHQRISAEIRDIFEDKRNEMYVSIISQIEMSTKHLKHKIPGLSQPIIYYFEKFRIDSEVILLNIKPEDVETAFSLPKIHSDPFDRLLISQALNNGMSIISPDKKFTKYTSRVIF